MIFDSAVAVIDYGVGNVGSIISMYRKLGIPVSLAKSPKEISKAARLILPGVGAFDHGARQLGDNGMMQEIKSSSAKGTPILGICLGMQLLAESSAEGELSGLGLIPGRCERFVSTVHQPIRVPHMGWNSVTVEGANRLLPSDGRELRFYFTHSFHLVGDPSQVIARSSHGVAFAAAVARENVMGVQFHPEKSHRFGMQLLQNFAALSC